MGSNNDPLVIIVTTNGYPGYNGKTCTATQGETKVTAQFANNQARLEVPKAGKWDITTDVDGSSTTSATFVGEQTVEVSVECTATIVFSHAARGRGSTSVSVFLWTNQSSYSKAVELQNSGSTVYGEHCAYFSVFWSDQSYPISLSCPLKEFGYWNYSGSFSTKGSINVQENKTYNIQMTGDLPIDPPEIFDDYPLSQPEEPTLEYLESLGKSEEEAQETLEVYRSERQRYLELEEQGLEADEILAEMYPEPDYEIV